MGKQRAPVAHLNNALEGKISYVSQYLHNSALNKREWALLNHNTHFDVKKEMKTIAGSLISPANQHNYWNFSQVRENSYLIS